MRCHAQGDGETTGGVEMPDRSILVADDIENQSDAGKRRSQAIRNAASFLAQRLKTGIDLVYGEDIKNYPASELGLFRFPEWRSKHEERLEAVGKTRWNDENIAFNRRF
jgi:hypothetical protein